MRKEEHLVFGREKEIERLSSCYESNRAELVIVYGRRRVGKTFLIRQFFKDKIDFDLTGIYNQPTKVQLNNFYLTLHDYGYNIPQVPKSWTEAFRTLRDYLKTISKKTKKVVFFDEMPWMDSGRSDFLPAFEHFWNSWGAEQNDLVFIVCGSATTWIVNNILGNIGGLYNRATARIYLHPFNLHETELYLRSKKIVWSRYDIVECYMIMGGIPFYLSQLRADLTYNQNIDNLFFVHKSVLWDEYANLYRTLFRNAEEYERIVLALSTKRMGLTREEIVSATGMANNGNLTKILTNLCNSDFVRPYQLYGNRKRGTIYQLADYYSLFYLHFLQNYHGRDEHFWGNTIDLPARRAWAGYAFEQVCKDHLSQIKQRIGIANVLSECSMWYSKERENGAQIDLLIDRRDRVINVCEIKYSMNPFVIDKEYDLKLREKIGIFRASAKTANKALHLTFITTFGIKPNMYSSAVQSEVTLDDLFL